jgi:hypothetical protein
MSTALLNFTHPARSLAPDSKHYFKIFFRLLGLGHMEERS